MSRLSLRTLLVVVALVAPACGQGDESLGQREILEAVELSNETPRVVVDRTGRLEVRAQIEDDYRFETETRIDGRPSVSEVVHDDRRFLRFESADVLAFVSGSLPTVASVEPGSWLEDSGGAAAEFGVTEVSRRLLAPAVTLDKIRFFETLPEALRSGLREWNPDAANYLEKDDRFEPHERDGRRFDVIPPPFDRDGFFREGVPADLPEALKRHFLWTSVWVKDGRLSRVEQLFDPPDLTGAIERALQLQARDAGITPDRSAAPPTPARWERSVVVTYPRPRPVVAIPAAVSRLDLSGGGTPEPPPGTSDG